MGPVTEHLNVNLLTLSVVVFSESLGGKIIEFSSVFGIMSITFSTLS